MTANDSVGALETWDYTQDSNIRIQHIQMRWYTKLENNYCVMAWGLGVGGLQTTLTQHDLKQIVY